MYWKNIYTSFLSESAKDAQSAVPYLQFFAVHQNPGFASDMAAVRKKFVREEINKYSGETGGHGRTFALKYSFIGCLIFKWD